MLREDKGAQIVAGFWRARLVSGDRPFVSVPRREHRRWCAQQQHAPVEVGQHDGRTWWLYLDRIYWDDDGLGADEVHALLAERERRKRRQIERAKDLLAAERSAPSTRREPIGEALRREIFRRDGGHCVECGSAELLQFDHIIPVAMGGATTAENLQLLCAPCNRAKGASL